MPTKTKSYKKFKNSYPRAHKFIKHAGNAITLASKAYSVAKTVAALVNAELKTYQVAPTGLTPSTTPIIYNICTPSKGTGVADRIGNSIMMKSALIKYEILWNVLGVNDQAIRVTLIVDRNSNTTADWSTPNDLFQSSGSMISLRAINNRKRFKVLSDTVHYRDTSVNRIEAKNIYTKGLLRKDKRGAPLLHHISFMDANQYGQNSLYLIIQSNVATNVPTMGITWEARFYDN